VYGGTGGFVSDKPQYDEPGYIATAPCMWGSPEHGLAPPPLMNGVTIRVEAMTNNTYGHHGEMALPQAMLAKGHLGPLSQCEKNATITAMLDVNTIFGEVNKPGTSNSVAQYIGNFSHFIDCERAFLEQATPEMSYTYLSAEYPQKSWRFGCYARQDGVFDPKADQGAVSGRCQSNKARYFEPEYRYAP
jgi:hypothetical protein